MFAFTGFDSILIVLIFLLGIIGLIRGFIKEVVSIFNWIGAFYLSGILKPLFIEKVRELIGVPFLSDLISNATLFVIILIIISIITKQISSVIKKFVPSEINGALGLLFGFIKGYFISMIILSAMLVIYQDKKPIWLEKSFSHNFMITKTDGFEKIIKVLMGDFIKSENKEFIEKMEVDSELFDKNLIGDYSENLIVEEEKIEADEKENGDNDSLENHIETILKDF